MKSLAVIVFLLIPFSIQAAAQSTSDTSVIRWSQSLPNADRIISNGSLIKILTLDKVSLAISLSEERLGTDQVHYDKFVVYCTVFNESERRVEISPNDFSVEVLGPKPKQLQRETAEHLAGTIQKWSNFRGALGQASANAQTTQTTSTGYESGTINTTSGAGAIYSGSSTSTTTSPDYQARQRAAAEAETLNRSARQSGTSLIAAQFNANTIFPQKTYSGLLIFDREKKAEEIIVRVRFEGKIVEFPFTRRQK